VAGDWAKKLDDAS